jgi:hypothetical protein
MLILITNWTIITVPFLYNKWTFLYPIHDS